MADERIDELPVVISAQLTDLVYAVQGYTSPSSLGTSVQQTWQQVFNLFQNTLVPTTFTPTITFGTAGDLSVVYTTQVGFYLQIGLCVFFSIRVVGTVTYTTASGNLQISALPVLPNSTASTGTTNLAHVEGTVTVPTGATYTFSQISPSNPLVTLFGQTPTTSSPYTTSNVPTGTAVTIYTSGFYFAAP